MHRRQVLALLGSASSGGRLGGQSGSPPTETVTVTRVDDPPEDPERVITEQVMRHAPLRNALASFEEGVTTVRVENAVARVHSAIYIDGRSYVEYEGQAYEVEVDERTNGT